MFDELAEAFEIKSYPWVASFVGGKKEEDMAGMGGWESFYNWYVFAFARLPTRPCVPPCCDRLAD